MNRIPNQFPAIKEVWHTLSSQLAGSIEQDTNANIVLAVEGNFTPKAIHITSMINNGVVVMIQYPPTHGIGGIASIYPMTENPAFASSFNYRTEYSIECDFIGYSRSVAQ